MSLVEYTKPAKPKAVTPLEFFEAVYMNPDLPLGTRLRAATEAAKYVHPRMAVVATAQVGDGFAEMLDRAIAASRTVRQPKVIEARPMPPNGHKSPEEVSAERMGKSFAPMRRRL